MKFFSSLLRLTRPVNLLIIIATLSVIRWLILQPLAHSVPIGMELKLSTLHFLMICAVATLLAGAGNVINDYFDRKVDQINKPDRVIVDKTVKRRIAMIMHIAMNSAAILLALLLCWTTGLWKGIILPIGIATILWWYSPVLKKQPLIGNLAVALCVAAVPLWMAYFEINTMKEAYMAQLPDDSVFERMWTFTWVYAGFAFVLTLAREALKDLEDLKGDIVGHYRTLPIVMGEAFTRFYTALLVMSALMASVVLSRIFFAPLLEKPTTLIWLSLCILLPSFVTFWLTLRSREKNHYTRASLWNKLTMVGGLIFAYHLSLWLIKQ